MFSNDILLIETLTSMYKKGSIHKLSTKFKCNASASFTGRKITQNTIMMQEYIYEFIDKRYNFLLRPTKSFWYSATPSLHVLPYFETWTNMFAGFSGTFALKDKSFVNSFWPIFYHSIICFLLFPPLLNFVHPTYTQGNTA